MQKITTFPNTDFPTAEDLHALAALIPVAYRHLPGRRDRLLALARREIDRTARSGVVFQSAGDRSWLLGWPLEARVFHGAPPALLAARRVVQGEELHAEDLARPGSKYAANAVRAQLARAAAWVGPRANCAPLVEMIRCIVVRADGRISYSPSWDAPLLVNV